MPAVPEHDSDSGGQWSSGGGGSGDCETGAHRPACRGKWAHRSGSSTSRGTDGKEGRGAGDDAGAISRNCVGGVQRQNDADQGGNWPEVRGADRAIDLAGDAGVLFRSDGSAGVWHVLVRDDESAASRTVAG